MANLAEKHKAFRQWLADSAQPACQFCGAPSVGLCAWPSEGFVTVRYCALKLGDRVRRALERLQHRPAATVLAIANRGRCILLDLEIRPGKPYKVVRVLPNSPVQVLRPMICGALVCEEHLRRVDEARVYCRDHWDAWRLIS